MMEARDVVEILIIFNNKNIEAWLDGGWGVDALLGEQTRPHRDIDVVILFGDIEKVKLTLLANGFKPIAGGCAANFVLQDNKGRKIDIHAAQFDKQGNGIYRMCNGKDWVYPAEGFSGKGKVAGIEVKCLSAKTQMLSHTGYELNEKDFIEMELLHHRFGIGYPKEYANIMNSRGV